MASCGLILTLYRISTYTNGPAGFDGRHQLVFGRQRKAQACQCRVYLRLGGIEDQGPSFDFLPEVPQSAMCSPSKSEPT